jgi:hypothetical protein
VPMGGVSRTPQLTSAPLTINPEFNGEEESRDLELFQDIEGQCEAYRRFTGTRRGGVRCLQVCDLQPHVLQQDYRTLVWRLLIPGTSPQRYRMDHGPPGCGRFQRSY